MVGLKNPWGEVCLATSHRVIFALIASTVSISILSFLVNVKSAIGIGSVLITCFFLWLFAFSKKGEKGSDQAQMLAVKTICEMVQWYGLSISNKSTIAEDRFLSDGPCRIGVQVIYWKCKGGGL